MTLRAPWIVLAACVVATMLPNDPVPTDPSHLNALPSVAHWLGTDHLGRDLLRRLGGALATLALPGVLAASVAVLGGTALGVGGSWMGEPTGNVCRAVSAAVLALPPLVTTLLVLMAAGAHAWSLGLAVGGVAAAQVGLRVAERVAALREAEFVLAARAHGIPDVRVLFHHVLRLSCGDVLLRGAVEAVTAVAALDVTLAYLGDLGVAEPTPSLGNVVVGALESGSANPFALVVTVVVLLAVTAPLAAYRHRPGTAA